MSENKYCGNCKHSYAKDMDGYCACGVDNHFTSCDEVCDNHILSINGWIELTTENADEINADLIVITDGTYYKMENEWHASLSTLAKEGGYYYYVLPELKIE